MEKSKVDSIKARFEALSNKPVDTPKKPLTKNAIDEQQTKKPEETLKDLKNKLRPTVSIPSSISVISGSTSATIPTSVSTSVSTRQMQEPSQNENSHPSEWRNALKKNTSSYQCNISSETVVSPTNTCLSAVEKSKESINVTQASNSAGNDPANWRGLLRKNTVSKNQLETYSLLEKGITPLQQKRTQSFNNQAELARQQSSSNTDIANSKESKIDISNKELKQEVKVVEKPIQSRALGGKLGRSNTISHSGGARPFIASLDKPQTPTVTVQASVKMPDAYSEKAKPVNPTNFPEFTLKAPTPRTGSFIRRKPSFAPATREENSSYSEIKTESVMVKSKTLADLEKLQKIIPAKNESCPICKKTVYQFDSVSIDSKLLHKACFKCRSCQRYLKATDCGLFEGVYYCSNHYKQLILSPSNTAIRK